MAFCELCFCYSVQNDGFRENIITTDMVAVKQINKVVVVIKYECTGLKIAQEF